MASTFFRFAELPAELRREIWRYAHDNEHPPPTDHGRTVELYHYDRKASKIRVSLSMPYPSLFAVNREARYEAAKLGGGEWVVPRASYMSGDNAKPFEIYFNFTNDCFFFSARFMTPSEDWKLDLYSYVAEVDCLKSLEGLFGKVTMNCIQRLMLTSQIHYQNQRAYEDLWNGRGLDVFRDG